MGRAVYFEAGGEQYSVFASLTPTLVARKLPAGWLREKLLPAQKHSTGYAQTTIPRLEDQLPGTTLRPADADGDIPIHRERLRGRCSWAPTSSWRPRRSPRCSRASCMSWAPPPRTPTSCGRALHLHHFWSFLTFWQDAVGGGGDAPARRRKMFVRLIARALGIVIATLRRAQRVAGRAPPMRAAPATGRG